MKTHTAINLRLLLLAAAIGSGCALDSNGGGGASGSIGGSGAIGGAGGFGAIGGSSGSGGSGGGMSVVCPGLTPFEGSPCSGVGQCVSESSGLPGCRTIWECLEDRWVSVFDAGCVGPSIDLCPLTAEEAVGQPCLDFPCVYEGAVVCACEQPCSGVMPDPDLLRTACGPAPRAVCLAAKQRGDQCSNLGEACSPSCCGTRWTCSVDGWQDSEVFCPP